MAWGDDDDLFAAIIANDVERATHLLEHSHGVQLSHVNVPLFQYAAETKLDPRMYDLLFAKISKFFFRTFKQHLLKV